MPSLFSFDNSYARLPPRFFEAEQPTKVAAPRLLRLNVALAGELGLDPERLAASEGVAALAGNAVPEGAEPIALAYAGHQFGHFVPKLGDGRAILLGELVDRAGARRDVQLKGAGRTRFSRGGDGRAAIGPVLREYLVSEAMHALGVPTTRSLAAVATGEPVMRDEPLPGAVLTRVASSHLRVGTFQYFAARGDVDALGLLVEHALGRHGPVAREGERPALALLDAVVGRHAELVAKWLLVGFVHGVMNTDNTSISGETLDYGPCAFLDEYDPAMVLSSIDRQGRYAYANQPRIAAWNLARLAEALLPLVDDDEARAVARAEEVLARFAPRFEATYAAGLVRKIGLDGARADDVALAKDLLAAMAEARADFTLVFRALAGAAESPAGDARVRALFDDPEAYDAWAARWRRRLAETPGDGAERAAAMRRTNPAYVPRNHLVEQALAAAREGDLGPFDELACALATPFDEAPGRERFMTPPRPEERVLATFCGT